MTNTRGVDARGPELSFDKGPGTVLATGHGTHSTTGSLTTFALPSDQQVARATATVFAQNGWTGKDVTTARGRKKKAVAVPTRIGDPSTIKHVFLLVKENRTYDQVYGDVAKGNGDPSLAQFGAKVTPNQHALANQFGLYDNFYDVGTNSAEGHNWVMQGDNPEYTESSAGEYVRSYDTENDVLGHQRSGFLWTAVQAAGGTARNFGEFMAFENKPETATWQQYYCAATGVEAGGDPAQLTDPAIKVDDHSPIPSLDTISNHDAPQFDTSIPDLYRYQVWKQEFERQGPANLNMMWLSSDHTGGPADPRAQVADGDLAVGKIVDEISHSRYWKSSAIFVVEDDSQDGADHVDGHRAPVQVISPYAKHGKVDHTYYSQITMVRTIEQILGAQPLNQKVAAATPMYGAFNARADLTPFDSRAHQVPLTEGVVTPPDCGVDTLGKKGAAAKKVAQAQERAAVVPDGAQQLAQQWQELGQPAALQRQRGDPRLRAPRAAEPLHLVPDPRVEEALPGRRPPLRPGRRSRCGHPGGRRGPLTPRRSPYRCRPPRCSPTLAGRAGPRWPARQVSGGPRVASVVAGATSRGRPREGVSQQGPTDTRRTDERTRAGRPAPDGRRAARRGARPAAAGRPRPGPGRGGRGRLRRGLHQRPRRCRAPRAGRRGLRGQRLLAPTGVQAAGAMSTETFIEELLASVKITPRTGGTSP